ncbi:hypothetical protein [Legionella clemsonensis]|uniref:Uncharacterized protein n=1 Tax=Legionella clemsonensis TaxID=1867846 RepID=A0A222NZJ8_9GAMM|nr:hypothetical protein [Legionella clemsonensis]ASQ45017.1 hypothetical protein clem_02270 [Legionella clemsonensis]
MRKYLLGLSFLALSQAISAHPIAQPTSCITSQFSAVGDQYWKTVTLRLTNSCGKPVDFQNTTVTFKSTTAINTSFWGSFHLYPTRIMH